MRSTIRENVDHDGPPLEEPPVDDIAYPESAQPERRPTRRQDHLPQVEEREERIVLGAMMESLDALGDILEIVGAGDFYIPKHATIFNSIVSLYGSGQPTGMVAVAGHLLTTGDIARVGGLSYLHDCIRDVPTVANGTYYARKVFDYAMRRRIVEAGAAVARYGTNLELDIDEVRSGAEEAVWSATLKADEDKGLQPTSALVDDALQEIRDAAQRGGGLRGITTGYADLDKLTSGYRPGQLIVVAGRPGMGKSISAVDAARANAIRDGKRVAMFSLEMSKPEIMNRILAAESRVPLSRLTDGTAELDDWRQLEQAAERLRKAPLHIDELAGASMTEIRSRALRLKRQNKDDLALLIVDYLQLMSPTRRTDSRQQEVADITRGMKLLAKELEIPIIAVAQLNRGVEQRADKRPQLSDLRESGAIEQDADIVILIHREDYYDREHVRAGEADLIVAKHRGGRLDTIVTAAQLHLSRFADMAVGA